MYDRLELSQTNESLQATPLYATRQNGAVPEILAISVCLIIPVDGTFAKLFDGVSFTPQQTSETPEIAQF
ncbi:hypothetical protein [Bradyrhizobium vignae]|uniref:hypothetical protein n=1 Tax=Bradyrhizobium vignae TaxID=1549949 RepID=UPI00100A93CE|nr:hypothetical protein [Bradyrhizobium vignae]RXG91874.1 hypothetical protein EAV90_27580 [Bradyrhizobium vignae]